MLIVTFVWCFLVNAFNTQITPVPPAYWTTYPPPITNRFGVNVSDIMLPGLKVVESGIEYELQTWHDDLKYSDSGIGGWTDNTVLRSQSGLSGLNDDTTDTDEWAIYPFTYTPDRGDETKYYYYHGDFSGAAGYAQGTVNSFYRYFKCPFEATLEVEYRTRFCGSETEDKIFLEVNGIQLGNEMTLGCSSNPPARGPRPGVYYDRGNTQDPKIDATCKGGGYASWSNCLSGEYRNVGELSFSATTQQWFSENEPIQVQFFWRYSYQDDNIWVYNIELTCKPTPRGLTGLHASVPESIKWNEITDWDQSPNWETTADSCGELIVSLPNGQFSSNGDRDGDGDQYTPLQAKKTGTAWCGTSATLDSEPTNYLQVDFGSVKDIGYIRTWGRPSGLDYTTEYKLQFSAVMPVAPAVITDDDFADYDTLTGNHNSNSGVTHRVYQPGSTTSEPLTARYLRFIPINAHVWPCLRVDAFYPPQTPLIAPLGIDAFKTRSTPSGAFNTGTDGYRPKPTGEYEAYQAKLTGTSWCGAAATVNLENTNYLEINLGAQKTIKYIHTFGRATSSDWVTLFKIEYKDINGEYHPIEEGKPNYTGNSDANTANVIELISPIEATHLRITPVAANNWPCLRIEAYESDGTTTSALISDLPDENFKTNPDSSSGYRTSDTYKPFQIKSTGTSWCGPNEIPTDVSTDYIQIDLGERKDILWIYTWGGGVSSTSATDWVSSYQFRWSNNPDGDFEPIRTIVGTPIVIPNYARKTNYDATSVVIWKLDKVETARYLRIIPKGSHNWPCMRIEVYPPFSDPLCLDDEVPKFFNNGYMIALEGRFRWVEPTLTNLMGSKNGGQIGYITEEHARPKFNEEFTTITQDGTSINIEIQNDGYIYLREWTTPFAHFDATGQTGIYYTFNTNPELDPVPNQRPSGAVTTIRECSLDGIVYVSEHAWVAADPKLEQKNEKIIIDDTSVITPINSLWELINSAWYNLLLTFAIFILFTLYCKRKRTPDYSKVANYENTETESEYV